MIEIILICLIMGFMIEFIVAGNGMRFGTLVSVLIVLGFSTLKAIELTSLQVFFGTSAILVGGLAIGDILLPLNI